VPYGSVHPLSETRNLLFFVGMPRRGEEQVTKMPNMTCDNLAKQLVRLQPDLSPLDVARLCLMILNQCENPHELDSESELVRAWKSACFRLEAAADQHAAVADELDKMCSGGPIQFSPDQLWTLLRAVKVQSQLLELYTDVPALA
jgi:hypothetical protein